MAREGIELKLRLDPQAPGHQFSKNLGEAPWRGAISGTIHLDDATWELLGEPNELAVLISPGGAKII